MPCFFRWLVAVVLVLQVPLTSSTVGTETCPLGKFFNEGLGECRPCSEICNSFEDSLQKKCHKTETCRGYWTNTLPTILITTPPNKSTAIPGNKTEGAGYSPTYTLLVLLCIVSLICGVISGFVMGKFGWIKSHLPCVKGNGSTVQSTADPEEMQSLSAIKNKNIQKIAACTQTDETHNCKSLNQIKPKSKDPGKFCGTPGRPLLSLDCTRDADSCDSGPN